MINPNLRGTYTRSDHFVIADSIGVPHPYCITPRHVAEASDYWMGRLGKEAIKAAERKGAKCGIRGCLLSYKEHETALVVHCYAPTNEEGSNKMVPELHRMLLANKDEATKNGYVGFAFVDKRAEAEDAEISD